MLIKSKQAQITNSTCHPRIPLRRLRAIVGAIVASALALTVLPGVAYAELVPCDWLDCPGAPVYAPEQVAIGRDRLLEVAQAEAEESAAATCPSGGGAYDVVRVKPYLLPHGSWRFTLTYRCESPGYDPYP